jgi:UDP-N-acetylmuramoylalanine-D-glutamate ligase
LQYALSKANEFFKNDYALIMCGNPKKEKIKSLNIHGPSMICIFGKHKKELNKIISHPKKFLSNYINDCFHEINQNEIQNILFSPGMPSPDDFINFEERGNYFIDELNFYQKNGKE